MHRLLIAAGNWKMHKTMEEASVYAEAFLPRMRMYRGLEVIICPPFTALSVLRDAFRGTNVQLGAQNVHWETQGAFTGEISVRMLQEFGCRYVIVGHSERRHIFRETSEEVGLKVKTLCVFGISPILCVGETLEERDKGRTYEVVREQLQKGVARLSPEEACTLVIAYEPVWAIGTGRAATPEDAEEVIAFIRGELAQTFGPSVAERVRILYGGSVTPDNVFSFVVQRNIDGTLVGGASLDPSKFLAIVEETERAFLAKSKGA
ncbi:MAG: triose-phosphate isomerase [Candidatus Caldatribacterium sp.]|uniref:triose-phosphate isomerase n=1 Tax=Candidatus Caldatribacterium sp. TaxID=2282143 RepID=UPI00299696B3|nr:triose-phosphate isomerase [Candidatus Caldatribacterium sp.]MCX7730092.1 triose-phosphate isomerase [Candidatus Caldatribacterium sp.]MDW8080478.1 triose-phosphate isomerase [Candidatus Calescibacterium sp.]